MDKRELVLSAMATGFYPVHVQKLFFLIDRRLAGDLGGPFYDETDLIRTRPLLRG